MLNLIWIYLSTNPNSFFLLPESHPSPNILPPFLAEGTNFFRHFWRLYTSDCSDQKYHLWSLQADVSMHVSNGKRAWSSCSYYSTYLGKAKGWTEDICMLPLPRSHPNVQSTTSTSTQEHLRHNWFPKTVTSRWVPMLLLHLTNFLNYFWGCVEKSKPILRQWGHEVQWLKSIYKPG